MGSSLRLSSRSTTLSRVPLGGREQARFAGSRDWLEENDIMSGQKLGHVSAVSSSHDLSMRYLARLGDNMKNPLSVFLHKGSPNKGAKGAQESSNNNSAGGVNDGSLLGAGPDSKFTVGNLVHPHPLQANSEARQGGKGSAWQSPQAAAGGSRFEGGDSNGDSQYQYIVNSEDSAQEEGLFVAPSVARECWRVCSMHIEDPLAAGDIDTGEGKNGGEEEGDGVKVIKERGVQNSKALRRLLLAYPSLALGSPAPLSYLRDGEGWSLLMRAADAGFLGVVRTLVDIDPGR